MNFPTLNLTFPASKCILFPFSSGHLFSIFPSSLCSPFPSPNAPSSLGCLSPVSLDHFLHPSLDFYSSPSDHLHLFFILTAVVPQLPSLSASLHAVSSTICVFILPLFAVLPFSSSPATGERQLQFLVKVSFWSARLSYICSVMVI